MDGIEDLEGDRGARLAVCAIVGGRKWAAGDATQGGGLADGLAAGGSSLSNLPQKGPEGESKGPATATGMWAIVALGEKVKGNPAFEE